MKKFKIFSIIFIMCLSISGSMFVPTPNTTTEAAVVGWHTFTYRFFGYPPKTWAVNGNGKYNGRPGTLISVAYSGGGYYIGTYKAWY